MEREKGVTTAPCYSCGTALMTTERADGSRAAVPCDCRTKAEAPPAIPPVVVLDPPPPPVIRENGVVGEADLLAADLSAVQDKGKK